MRSTRTNQKINDIQPTREFLLGDPRHLTSRAPSSGGPLRLMGWAAGVVLLLIATGCTPPRGSDEPVDPPAVEEPKAKAPASTAYAKALEAADRLKSQAQDYNDRLEKLSDPTVK
jgi:hypothetical protein